MPHVPFHQTLSINENGYYGHPAPQFGVRYHQQDNHGAIMYCGAAVAQMALDSLRNPFGATGASLIGQEVLYGSHQVFAAHDPLVDWFTEPHGLWMTLDTLQPGIFTFSQLGSEAATSRKLCWAIHQGLAPIALVEAGTHWIVVVGFEATAAPTSAADMGYQILSFDVFNPWPPTPYLNPPPPPHAHAGDNCGMGKVGVYNRGDQYQTIFYDPFGGAASKYWSTYYMTPVPLGIRAGDCIAICDADPPADTQDMPNDVDSNRVTDLDAIEEIAAAGLDATGQSRRAQWMAALEGAGTSEPFLVQREDYDSPRFYAIVPFRRGEDVPVLVLVDPHGAGGIAGTVAVPEGTTHFRGAVDLATILESYVGRTETIGGVDYTLVADDLYEFLVWRPCVESLSPYWPFHRFDVGGQGSGIHVYVRIDGEIFSELHVRGGM